MIGSYILNWLYENNYTYIKYAKDKQNKTFTTLISKDNQIFSLFIYIKVGNKTVVKITFYDSFKILPLSVAKIAEAFGLKEKKGRIDYLKYRPEDYIPTKDEIDYVINDCVIIGKALFYFFDMGLTKITLGSNALLDFKNTLGYSRFIKYFPYLEKNIDQDLRKAFAGGYLFLNSINQNKIIKNVTVLDVNALYSSIMNSKFLPIGYGEFFTGEYQYDAKYNLYIQSFSCSFKLKPGKLPTIKLDSKEYEWEWLPGEYATSSHNKIVNLIMTNIDYELFRENYDVQDLKFRNGWKFRSAKGLFTPYITKWNNIKEQAELENNKPRRLIAKYMLNYLFGKFSTRIEDDIKEPYFDSKKKCIAFKTSIGTAKNGIYVPISIFVTAYGRDKIIRQAQKVRDFSLKKYGKDCYIYSDTDSIHTSLPYNDILELFKIDNKKMGLWKIEGTYEESKFLKIKTYCHKNKDKYTIVCSGLSKNLLYYKKIGIGNNKYIGKYKKIKETLGIGKSKFYKKDSLVFRTLEMEENGKEKEVEKIFKFDEFKKGFTVKGKLGMEQREGGIKLIEKTFTISDNNIVQLLKKSKLNNKIKEKEKNNDR